jgi:hypothetical protein
MTIESKSTQTPCHYTYSATTISNFKQLLRVVIVVWFGTAPVSSSAVRAEYNALRR